MAGPTLPPILYWSPSAAEHPDASIFTPGLFIGPDEHGLIWSTSDEGRAVVDQLPADARRLVVELPADRGPRKTCTDVANALSLAIANLGCGCTDDAACDAHQLLDQLAPDPADADAGSGSLPVTLSTVNDVSAVCEAAGLTWDRVAGEWHAGGVRVERAFGLGRLAVVSQHVTLYGRRPIAELFVGAETSVLCHAIAAAQSAS